MHTRRDELDYLCALCVHHLACMYTYELLSFFFLQSMTSHWNLPPTPMSHPGPAYHPQPHPISSSSGGGGGGGGSSKSKYAHLGQYGVSLLPGRQADETQDCFTMEPLMEDLIEYTLGAFLIQRCPWHKDIGQGNIFVGFLC